MADRDASRLHAIVEGRVQGVGFRYYVLERAIPLGLNGWVRNTFDERVEVTAEGPRAALEALLSDLRLGPRAAFVSNVEFEWGEATGEYRSFNVVGSAG